MQSCSIFVPLKPCFGQRCAVFGDGGLLCCSSRHRRQVATGQEVSNWAKLDRASFVGLCKTNDFVNEARAQCRCVQVRSLRFVPWTARWAVSSRKDARLLALLICALLSIVVQRVLLSCMVANYAFFTLSPFSLHLCFICQARVPWLVAVAAHACRIASLSSHAVLRRGSKVRLLCVAKS